MKSTAQYANRQKANSIRANAKNRCVSIVCAREGSEIIKLSGGIR